MSKFGANLDCANFLLKSNYEKYKEENLFMGNGINVDGQNFGVLDSQNVRTNFNKEKIIEEIRKLESE